LHFPTLGTDTSHSWAKTEFFKKLLFREGCRVPSKPFLFTTLAVFTTTVLFERRNEQPNLQTSYKASKIPHFVKIALRNQHLSKICSNQASIMIRGRTSTQISNHKKNKLFHEPFLSSILLIMKGKRKSIKVKTVQDEEKFLTQLKIHKR
jgi:hypothetical protein